MAPSEQPHVVELADQPYVAIRARVSMSTIPQIADRFPGLFGHLAERGITPTGAPFLRYLVLGPGEALEMEAGVPVGEVPEDFDAGACSVLPGGRYATVSHHGPPEGLMQATADLLDWAASQGLTWDMSQVGDVQNWGARLEVYTTDPRVEPDPNNWDTDLRFRLA